MQYLEISRSTTLAELSKIVGRNNVDEILTVNGLTRTREVGKVYFERCSQIAHTSTEVTAQQKIALMNTLTSDAEVFETAGLMSDTEWKVFKSMGTLPNTLAIPPTVKLPDSVNIIGGTGRNVSSVTYKKTIESLTTFGTITPTIFDTYSATRARSFVDQQNKSDRTNKVHTGSDALSIFNLPWGKITLQSTLSGESFDIPAYPEELEDAAIATYQTMPDLIYQYEPWFVYTSSGPRSNEFTFHLHRDMWTGDHTDGMANELIRFCEANCYPKYSGSAVFTSKVKLYIDGSLYISGILTSVNVKWMGPIGHDGFYLEFELTLAITEVAEAPKTYESVRQLGLKGSIQNA